MIIWKYAYMTIAGVVAFAITVYLASLTWKTKPVISIRLFVMLWMLHIKQRALKAIKDRMILFFGNRIFLRKATKKAEQLNATDGRRYRVFFLDGRYRVYNRDQIKALKKEGKFANYINSTTIDPLKDFDTNDLPYVSISK